MGKQNLDSTDYDVNQVTNYDRRMEAGKKDALFFHGIGLIASVLATVCMYVFGSGDPAKMVYFLGLPVWYTGGVLVYLVMFVIGLIYISKWELFSLKAREETKGGERK